MTNSRLLPPIAMVSCSSRHLGNFLRSSDRLGQFLQSIYRHLHSCHHSISNLMRVCPFGEKLKSILSYWPASQKDVLVCRLHPPVSKEGYLASTVAVVVPSPASSLVLLATSWTRRAPMFWFLSSSSIPLATVTPSLVIFGLPQDFSKITLRPYGVKVWMA